MMNSKKQILAISGSLRSGALNTALIRAAQGLAPINWTVEVFEGLGDIPPYNEDVRAVGFPAPVEFLRERVRSADALIFATPEYNRSFSGVLKNAIDWVSRPPEQPFAGKAALVIGAGPGALGTALANYQLRQVLSVLGVHVSPGLEVLVGSATEKFDSEGRLTHELTRETFGKALAGLANLADALEAH